MTIQKKFLVCAVFLAFSLTLIGIDDSYAKKNWEPPVIDTPPLVTPGTVLEIVSGDVEFDFFRIQNETSDQWVAAPKKGFAVGDVVSCEDGLVLENYNIQGLNRTFEKIVFTECSK